jgi:hypothetical protein
MPFQRKPRKFHRAGWCSGIYLDCIWSCYFESQPDITIPTEDFCGFPQSLSKPWDVISIRSGPLPSKFFSIHHSSIYHSTLYSLDTGRHFSPLPILLPSVSVPLYFCDTKFRTLYTLDTNDILLLNYSSILVFTFLTETNDGQITL